MNVQRMIGMMWSFLALLMLPSCIKHYEVLQCEFPQGCKYETTADITRCFVRSQSVYEQFSTNAIFDVLWLADDVRLAHVDLYARKRGIAKDVRDQMLRQDLEENNHWITFFVLADVRDNRGNGMLSEKDAYWSLYLDVGKRGTVVPETVKEVELEPEIQALFGKTYNHFKIAYLVRFPVADADGNEYMRAGQTPILVASSPHKKCCFSWDNCFDACKGGQLNEDFYWG